MRTKKRRVKIRKIKGQNNSDIESSGDEKLKWNEKC